MQKFRVHLSFFSKSRFTMFYSFSIEVLVDSLVQITLFIFSKIQFPLHKRHRTYKSSVNVFRSSIFSRPVPEISDNKLIFSFKKYGRINFSKVLFNFTLNQLYLIKDFHAFLILSLYIDKRFTRN